MFVFCGFDVGGWVVLELLRLLIVGVLRFIVGVVLVKLLLDWLKLVCIVVVLFAFVYCGLIGFCLVNSVVDLIALYGVTF